MGNKCLLPLFDPYLRAYFSENGAKYSNPLLHLIRILILRMTSYNWIYPFSKQTFVLEYITWKFDILANFVSTSLHRARNLDSIFLNIDINLCILSIQNNP